MPESQNGEDTPEEESEIIRRQEERQQIAILDNLRSKSRALFQETRDLLRSRIDGLSEAQLNILSLVPTIAWMVRKSYSIYTPYVLITGRAGSGKSYLTEILVRLCDGVWVSNVSPAAIPRIVREGQPLGIDELDEMHGETREMVEGILRTGYHIGGSYVRAERDGPGIVEIKTFCLKLFNARTEVEDALRDRCVVVILMRTNNQEIVKRSKKPLVEAQETRVKWKALCEPVTGAIWARMEPDESTYPEGADPRQWLLFSIFKQAVTLLNVPVLDENIVEALSTEPPLINPLFALVDNTFGDFRSDDTGIVIFNDAYENILTQCRQIGYDKPSAKKIAMIAAELGWKRTREWSRASESYGSTLYTK